ncbi:unnamed protein product [Amoebophrya sp. A120]|nr:unnamed protein product [Amoebophrya sp. A120]|eukprot:GSA120T00003537001.1
MRDASMVAAFPPVVSSSARTATTASVLLGGNDLLNSATVLTSYSPGLFNLGSVVLFVLLVLWAAKIAHTWAQYLETHKALELGDVRVLQLAGMSPYQWDMRQLEKMHMKQILRMRYRQPSVPIQRCVVPCHAITESVRLTLLSSTSTTAPVSSNASSAATTSTSATSPQNASPASKRGRATGGSEGFENTGTAGLAATAKSKTNTGSSSSASSTTVQFEIDLAVSPAQVRLVRAELLLGVRAEDSQTLISMASSRSRVVSTSSSTGRTDYEPDEDDDLFPGENVDARYRSGMHEFLVDELEEAPITNDITRSTRTASSGGPTSRTTAGDQEVVEQQVVSQHVSLSVPNIDLDLVRQRRVPMLFLLQTVSPADYERHSTRRSSVTVSPSSSTTTASSKNANYRNDPQHASSRAKTINPSRRGGPRARIGGKPVVTADVEASLWKINSVPPPRGGAGQQAAAKTTSTSTSQLLPLELIRQVAIAGEDAVELAAIYGFEDAEPEDPASAECMICYERTKNCMLLPCRHCSTCSVCLRSLREEKCPLCRSQFDKHVSFPRLRRTSSRNRRGSSGEGRSTSSSSSSDDDTGMDDANGKSPQRKKRRESKSPPGGGAASEDSDVEDTEGGDTTSTTTLPGPGETTSNSTTRGGRKRKSCRNKKNATGSTSADYDTSESTSTSSDEGIQIDDGVESEIKFSSSGRRTSVGKYKRGAVEVVVQDSSGSTEVGSTSRRSRSKKTKYRALQVTEEVEEEGVGTSRGTAMNKTGTSMSTRGSTRTSSSSSDRYNGAKSSTGTGGLKKQKNKIRARTSPQELLRQSSATAAAMRPLLGGHSVPGEDFSTRLAGSTSRGPISAAPASSSTSARSTTGNIALPATSARSDGRELTDFAALGELESPMSTGSGMIRTLFSSWTGGLSFPGSAGRAASRREGTNIRSQEPLLDRDSSDTELNQSRTRTANLSLAPE